MFDEKKKTLYSRPSGLTASGTTTSLENMNALDKYAYYDAHRTTSGNGAEKLDTTGDIFVDDFAAIARYKACRKPKEIFTTVDAEWDVDPLKTLKMAAYIRSISRETSVETADATETFKVIGQGLRWEYFFRILRIASKDLNVFIQNADLLISLGSEKDMFDLWRIQLSYGENVIPEDVLASIILSRLNNKRAWNLVMKYLPTIRTKAKQSTLTFEMNSYIGRYLSDKLYPDMPVEMRRASYRRLKSSGKAHTWQQHISRQEYKDIDWNKISGMALTKLSRSKFLSNHGLTEEFQNWLSAKPTGTVHTTSYVYDLLCPTLDVLNQQLANQQFETLIQRAGDCKSRLLTAIDVSGSMGSKAVGTKYMSISVAYAMAAYFSRLLKGEFADNYVTFSTHIKMHKFDKNETPYDRVHKHNTEWDFGSTDFQQVIKLLCDMRKKMPQVSEAEFPTGILCVSDGEFNYCGHNLSNFGAAKKMLAHAGFSKEYVDNFTIVLWDIPNGYYNRTKPVFECLADTPNFFHMSGFDPTGIAFLTSGEYVPPKTNLELLETALNQDALQLLKV